MPSRHNGGTVVLIIGGGVAGATAADRLGRAGVEVHLVEREHDIGGHARQMGCKATDICLRCNVCVADAVFRSVQDLPTVHVHTSTDLHAFRHNGQQGRFQAVLNPRSASGNGHHPSTTLSVDAAIIATGYEPYDPSESSAYGYGRNANVMTAIEAERQLAENGRITRPSDGTVPARIAFVQCVGSRTEEIHRRPEDTDYCSCVCCAYALRMARLISHQADASAITLFYMDIQTFGKGFNAFYADCRERVRLIRSRPYGMTSAAGGGVRLSFAPPSPDAQAAVCEETFDLVVLSVGIRPPAAARELADKLGVALDAQGFFGLKGETCLPDLQREGIFVAGACEWPKDIAGCMAQAEAVAAAVMARTGHRPSAVVARDPGADPIKAKWKKVNHKVVVVGGGVAGLQASVALADLGLRVALVLRDQQPGGTVAALPECFGHVADGSTDTGEAVRHAVARLIRRVTETRNITVHPESALAAVDGERGHLTVRIQSPRGSRCLRAGAVVLATGAALEPAPYPGAAESPRIGSLMALVDMIRHGNIPRRVALVMDFCGEQGRSVTGPLLSVAERLARQFGSRVTIFCRHMGVNAHGLERLYRRAREAGVVVVKSETPPAIDIGSTRDTIRFEDPVTGMHVEEGFDFVATADMKTSGGSDAVVRAVKGLRPGPENALQHDNVWLLPTLTNRPGVFVVGGARGECDYRQALTDGQAAADRVYAALAQDKIQVWDDAAVVDEDKCVQCLTCVRVCPHGAVTLDENRKAVRVSAFDCQRCGVCAAECPSRAISLPRYTDEKLETDVGVSPRVTLFACENSAIPAAQAIADRSFGANVELVRIPCAGRVAPREILAALERGAAEVIVLGCHPESCRYLTGATRASRRVARLSTVLHDAGIDGSRVRFGGISSVEPHRFLEYAKGAT